MKKYQLLEYNTNMDLSSFFAKAKARGYENNINHKIMIDAFNNEKKSQVWILFRDNQPVGSVAAHTFPEMGDNSFRIMARTCTVDEGSIPNGGLNTRRQIINHQNISCRFYLPKMIEWCGIDSNMYITSNELEHGSQRLVNRVYFPTLEKQGEFERITTIEYRGAKQTVWKLNAQVFLDNLSKTEWEGHALL